jgi:hypothetical protein
MDYEMIIDYMQDTFILFANITRNDYIGPNCIHSNFNFHYSTLLLYVI